MQSILQFSPEQLNDCVSQILEMFLQTNLAASGETTFSLGAATKQFINTVSTGLSVYDKLRASVQYFKSPFLPKNPQISQIQFDVARLFNRQEFARAAELLSKPGYSAEITQHPIFNMVDTTKATAKHAPKEKNRRTVIGLHAAAAMRLLILTGARLREILHLRWEHVDLERGLLFLPDSKTGKKAIVLNAPAMAVLAGLIRVGHYVIAGQDAGTSDEKPRADLNRPWRAVAKRAGLQGVRIHDLRHTHASIGAGAGLGLPIIGKLLGHTKASTTQRYAHLDTDPLRRASENIGRRLSALMGDPANRSARRSTVVRMPRPAL
jgi:integrase